MLDGESIDEYLAKNCEFIGILGSKTETNITPNDISLDKINNNLKEDRFLLCLVMVSAWWVCLIFNSDGAKEIKAKYKGKIMLWYWASRECIKYCMPSMQYKEFLNEFPEK